jgi:hypothetical protein
VEIFKIDRTKGLNWKAVVACLSFFIFFSNFAHSTQWSETEKLLKHIGVYDSLDGFDELFIQGVQQSASKSSADPVITELFSRAAKNHLNNESLITIYNQKLKPKITPEIVHAANTWYYSDLGSKINVAEEKINDPEAQAEMMAMAGDLMANQERVALVSKITSSLNMSEMMITMQNQIAITLIENMAAANGNSDQQQMEAIKQQILNNSAASKAQLDQFITLTLLYAHQDFEIDELKKYQAFITSDNGIALNLAMIEAFTSTLSNAMSALSLELQSSLKTIAKAN